MSQQLLNNGTIALRALEMSDLETLYSWENDTTLWSVTDTIAPYSHDALKYYLETYTGDIYAQGQLRLMIVMADSGEPVGTIDFMNFSPLNNRAELGLFIDAQHRGKGLGAQALQLLMTYAREHIGLRQLYVYIGVENTPCLALFEQEDFHKAGILRDWVKRGNTYHDVALLQKRL